MPERLRGVPWRIVGPVVVYLVLVLLGVTMSSVGISTMRQDPAHPHGLQLGEPVELRSDEYLTSMPFNLGVTATGSSESLNPLTAPHGFISQLPSGPVSSIVLLDGAALRLGPYLPDAWLVAARWWLPLLLLALGAPAFFGTLTGNRWMGAFAAALMAVSPATAWWSLAPLPLLGFTIAGVAAMQRCSARWLENRRPAAVGWGLGAAVLLARTPLHYQPWAIVLAAGILLTGVAGMLANRATRTTSLVVVLSTGAVAALLLLGLALENWASIQAVLHTTYPGARVSSGTPKPMPDIFAATALGQAEHLPIADGTNRSVISSSFAVAAVWAVLLLARGVVFRDAAHRAASITLTAVTGFWFAWALVDFGTIGAKIPVIDLVPATRAADVLGYLSIALVCLLLPGLQERSRVAFPLLCGGVVFLVAANAASLMRTTFPTLTSQTIWISSLVLALVVATITWRPRWFAGYVVAVLLGASLVWQVNPVLVGLADMRGTTVADQMLRDGTRLRAAGEVVASDSWYVDSLMIGTGVPAISGHQLAGPDRESWEQLVPGGDEDVWNRGAAYITFTWTDDRELTVSNPGVDVINVAGSPCTVAERLPQLTGVISGRRLDLPCLTPTGSFRWSGIEHWTYAVDHGTD
ncbi:DUF7657 domain-containing protein [Cellulomonas sp. URHB0016]